MNGWQMQPVYKLATLAAWVDEPVLADLKLIDQEKYRVIAYWRRVPYQERDRQFLKECFYQYQADIVLMLDSLFGRSAEVLSKALKKVLAALMSCLEALLEFIERHRPLYFNMGQRVPECIRLRKMLELNNSGANLPLKGCCTFSELRRMGRVSEGENEEMTEEERKMMERYLSVWGDFKIRIQVSVALFGMLLGTLINAKVMEPDNRERDLMMKFFAQHISTEKHRDISYNSLHNASYARDISLQEKLIRLLDKMIGILKCGIEKARE